MQHITVLQQEVLNGFSPKKDAVIVDCTLGSGGHAIKLIETLGKEGVYIGIDQDPTALEASQKRIGSVEATVHYVLGNFRDITKLIKELNIQSVDYILADLGWRIEQFDGTSGIKRGFSFNTDEPLAMTYGDPDDYAFTAADIVNEWSEEDIANVIYAYGQEHYSRRIAKAIVEYRSKQTIATAKELADIIYKAVPSQYAKKKIHPATKSFQGLRIAVNDEFDSLSTLITDGFLLMKKTSRMAIISFHSLEDKIIKEEFRSLKRDNKAVLVNKKPIVASREEIKNNPRSRSAKLRIIEKI